VKGLASGFEYVARLDVILTMRAEQSPADAALPQQVDNLLRRFEDSN
jgi:hypothetical protein